MVQATQQDQKVRPFPRRVPLPCPAQPPADSSLHFSNIKASAITDPAYWQQVCRKLHVSQPSGQSSQMGSTLQLRPEVAAQRRQQMDEEGACTVHADELPWKGMDWTVLATAVVQLMQHGWPPSFLLMYDEAWQLVHQLGGVMKATTGNEINMDILAWYVDPNRGEVGFSPHRDRQPPDVPSSFRPDGSARYTTAWVPFTDACPENSCLYMLPRWADPGYYDGDATDGPDPLPLALSTKESYQNIRAYPAEAGAAVIFTHRTIHWGSKGRAGYHTPRICLAAACADDTFEPAYFDRAKHLPCPSLAMRAALACGQMIVYHERFQLTPKQLSLFKRTFMAHAQEFHPTYRAKVLSEFVAATKEAQAAPSTVQQPTLPSQPQPVSSNGVQSEVAAGSKDVQKVSSKQTGQASTEPLLVAVVAGAEGATDGPHMHAGGKKRGTMGANSTQDGQQASKKAKIQAADVEEDSKKKKKAKSVVLTSVGGKQKKTKQQEESEEEEEGPGFEFLQLHDGSLKDPHGATGDHEDLDESDVDLIDEELDALLEARLDGVEDDFAFEDDFTSDMEDDELHEGLDDNSSDDDEDIELTGNGVHGGGIGEVHSKGTKLGKQKQQPSKVRHKASATLDRDLSMGKAGKPIAKQHVSPSKKVEEGRLAGSRAVGKQIKHTIPKAVKGLPAAGAAGLGQAGHLGKAPKSAKAAPLGVQKQAGIKQAHKKQKDRT